MLSRLAPSLLLVTLLDGLNRTESIPRLGIFVCIQGTFGDVKGDAGEVKIAEGIVICRHLFRIAVYIGEFFTSVEGKHLDGGGAEDGEIGDVAEHKGLFSNARYTIGNYDGGEAAATPECTISDVRHALGNSDVGKSYAIPESITSNARHALRDGDSGKVATNIECIVFNRSHALGNVDGGETFTITECIGTNAFHILGDNSLGTTSN